MEEERRGWNDGWNMVSEETSEWDPGLSSEKFNYLNTYTKMHV